MCIVPSDVFFEIRFLFSASKTLRCPNSASRRVLLVLVFYCTYFTAFGQIFQSGLCERHGLRTATDLRDWLLKVNAVLGRRRDEQWAEVAIGYKGMSQEVRRLLALSFRAMIVSFTINGGAKQNNLYFVSY